MRDKIEELFGDVARKAHQAKGTDSYIELCSKATSETLALFQKLVESKKKYHQEYDNYMGVKALDDLLSEIKK